MKRTKHILLIILTYYCFFAALGVILFNVRYLADHGWQEWLPHGLAVSTLQGIYKPALIPYYIVKEFVDDRQLKRDVEADPYCQSLLRAADAMTMVRGRSFADLDRDKRHKVMMKCAEAYALATLPSTQPPDENEQHFRKYLRALSIVAHEHYLFTKVEKVDQALEIIRDYLWQLEYAHGYDTDR